MAWTIEDDAAFFAAHGYSTHMGTDLAAAHERFAEYEHLAKSGFRLWWATATTIGGTSWGRGLDVMADDNPFGKAMHDVSCGLITLSERVVLRLDLLFDPDSTGDSLRPDELRIYKQEAGAIFHEMSHTMGPADREQFVKERVETNKDDRAQRILEGGTELRVQRDINKFLALTGIATRAPGILGVAYVNHYPAEVAFVAGLFDVLSEIGRTTPDRLLDRFGREGYSLRAIGDIVVDSVSARGISLDEQGRRDAVECVLVAAESVSDIKGHLRGVPGWAECGAQVGNAGAAKAATNLSRYLGGLSRGGAAEVAA